MAKLIKCLGVYLDQTVKDTPYAEKAFKATETAVEIRKLVPNIYRLMEGKWRLLTSVKESTALLGAAI